MSLLDATILITGLVTVTVAIGLVVWFFYILIKAVVEEPCFINLLAFIAILCLFTFVGCLAYVEYTEKDEKEYQKYLDLKAKYEKEIK